MPSCVVGDCNLSVIRRCLQESVALDFPSNMTEEVFKAPRNKRRPLQSNSEMSTSPHKKKRTKEDFMDFCAMVLTYTQYESHRQDEMRSTDNVSPLDSGGSTAESYEAESTESANSTMSLSESEHYGSREDSEPEDDSHELITCFCLKPYAGRPMIECNECLTWIHLSCAKIRKTNIPEDFTCQRCRDAKFTTRKSTRMRIESKRIST
ncbi:PHD finger protein 23B-like [Haliotis asinina]|uniref:PHD finger protein 23B-like n=1 Tax=Haliotis asinina TaxID=109174 RepID=UPI00353266AC